MKNYIELKKKYNIMACVIEYLIPRKRGEGPCRLHVMAVSGCGMLHFYKPVY